MEWIVTSWAKIVAVFAFASLVATGVTAWHIRDVYVQDLERRIEVLERIDYSEHPEYTLMIYWATGKGYPEPTAGAEPNPPGN